MFNYLWNAHPEDRGDHREAEQDQRRDRAAKRAAAKPPPVPARRQDSQPQQEDQPRQEDHPPQVPIRRQGSHPDRATTPRCEPLGEDLVLLDGDFHGFHVGPDGDRPEDAPHADEPDLEEANPPPPSPPDANHPGDPDNPHDGGGNGGDGEDGEDGSEEGEEDDMAANAPVTDPRLFRLKSQIKNEFDIDTQADRWEEWRILWEAFMNNTGMQYLVCTTDGQPDAAKRTARNTHVKSALMSSFTISTVRAVRSLGLTEVQRQDPEAILRALDTHITGASSPMVFRVELIQRQRREGETFDQFLSALRLLAARCQFEPGREEENMICLAITAGIRVPEVAEKLLRMPHNTPLTELTTKARAIMAAKRDHSAITHQRGSRPAAHRVQTVDRPPPPTQGWNNHRATRPARPPPRGDLCPTCGFDPHRPPKQCPAIGQSCMHCGGVGHYRRVCTRNPNRYGRPRQPPGTAGPRQPSAANAAYHTGDLHPAADPTPQQHPQAAAPTPYAHAALYDPTPLTPYTGPVSYSAVARASYSVTAGATNNRYEKFEALPTTQVWIQGASKPIRFLADTGANFNVISTRDYLALGLPTAAVDPNSPMQEDPRLANGKGGGMGIKGVTKVRLATTTAAIEADLYVAKQVDQPLLSRKATLALGILQEPPPQQ